MLMLMLMITRKTDEHLLQASGRNDRRQTDENEPKLDAEASRRSKITIEQSPKELLTRASPRCAMQESRIAEGPSWSPQADQGKYEEGKAERSKESRLDIEEG